MINKTVQFLIYILVFLTPLIMSDATSEIFEFNKLLFIYFIALTATCLWLFDVIVNYRKVKIYPLIIIPFAIFLLSQIASTAFSIDFHTSIFGYYGRFNGGLLSIISYFVLFFVGFQVFEEKKHVLNIIYVSIASSLIVFFWGLTGKLGFDFTCYLFMHRLDNSCWTAQFRPAERMFSTLGQPNWLGAYFVIHFCLGLWLYFKEKKSFWSFSYLFLILLGILFTKSRSALFAVIVCGGVFISFMIYHLNRNFDKFVEAYNVKIKMGILFLAGFLAVIVFGTGIDKVDSLLYLENYLDKYVEEDAPIEEEPAPQVKDDKVELKQEVSHSFDIRKIVWKGALDLGFNYPLLGTGVETFAYAYYFVRPIEHNLTSEWDFIYNKAHNEFLNYFATTGILGFTAYIFMLGAVLYLGWLGYDRKKSIFHDNNLLNIVLSLAYLSILITNFFGFSVTTVNVLFYLIPVILIVLNSKVLKLELFEAPKINSFIQSVLILVLIISYVLFIRGIYNYWQADIAYSKGKTFIASQNYDQGLKYLEEALNKKYEHVYHDEISAALSHYSLLVGYEDEDSKEATDEIIKLSEGYNAASLRASPQNVLYWKTKGRNEYFYYYATESVKFLEQGIKTLSNAEKIAPTDPKVLHSKALIYSLLAAEFVDKDGKKFSDYKKKSLESLEKAIELKKNYRDAYVLMGQLLVQYDDEEQARRMFNFVLKNIEPNDTEVRKELEELNK